MTLETEKAIGKLLINYRELILVCKLENLLKEDYELIKKIIA